MGAFAAQAGRYGPGDTGPSGAAGAAPVNNNFFT